MNHVMAFCGSMTLLAAFVAGSAGSVHCLAMCGGLSGALGLRARRIGASSARSAGHAVTYQAGRLCSYSLAGALAGGVGASFRLWVDVDRLAEIMRVMAGVLLIAAAWGLLFRRRPLAPLERLGAGVWKRLAPLARRIPAGNLGGSFGIGLLWGFLPCGMVYSLLLIAALAGSMASGAATMLFFGLGTLPAVLGAALASSHALRLGGGERFRMVAGTLLLICGVLSVLGPLSLHLQRYV